MSANPTATARRSLSRIARDAARGMLYFMLAGPALGAAAVLTVWCILWMFNLSEGDRNEFVTRLVFLIMCGFVFAYILGTIPALVIGLIAGLFRGRGDRRSKAMLCGLLGAALAAISIDLIGLPSLMGSFSGWEGALKKYGLMGFLPGFCSGLILTYRFDRPPPQTNCPATHPDDQAH